MAHRYGPQQIGVFDIFWALRWRWSTGPFSSSGITIPTDLSWVFKLARKFPSKTREHNRFAVLQHDGHYLAVVVYAGYRFWDGCALMNEDGRVLFESKGEAVAVLNWRLAFLENSLDLNQAEADAKVYVEERQHLHYAKQGVRYEPDAWRTGGPTHWLDGSVRENPHDPIPADTLKIMQHLGVTAD